MERWKNVIGYEGYYQVSNLGRVRSLGRVVRHQKGGPMKLVGRVLRSTPGGRCGHLQVKLCKDRYVWHVLVHRLVLTAWIGSCPEGFECLHGPAGVSDNSVSNLRWGTRKENELDKIRDGTHNGVPVIRSDGVEFISMTAAAKESGCSKERICDCCKGRQKTTGGYSWKYKE